MIMVIWLAIMTCTSYQTYSRWSKGFRIGPLIAEKSTTLQFTGTFGHTEYEALAVTLALLCSLATAKLASLAAKCRLRSLEHYIALPSSCLPLSLSPTHDTLTPTASWFHCPRSCRPQHNTYNDYWSFCYPRLLLPPAPAPMAGTLAIGCVKQAGLCPVVWFVQ